MEMVEEAGGGGVGGGADLEEELDGWVSGGRSVEDINTVIQFRK